MANVDIRIRAVDSLLTPDELNERLPVDDATARFITDSRSTIEDIIKGRDGRLLAIVGPCSLHDPVAAVEYATRLKALSDQISDVMYVVMRTYFEKPRTVGGWKGLILDPRMDGSYDIESGIIIARTLLLDIVHLGLPVGCEVLDPTSPAASVCRSVSKTPPAATSTTPSTPSRARGRAPPSSVWTILGRAPSSGPPATTAAT